MMAVIVSVVALWVGASHAEDQAPQAVPPKVQAALEKMVGTWNVEGDPGPDGVSLRGRSMVRWSPGKHYLLMNSRYKIGETDGSDNAIVGWDGLSEDGIIIFRKAPVGFHEIYRFKAVSDTVNEGWNENVAFGSTDRTWRGHDNVNA